MSNPSTLREFIPLTGTSCEIDRSRCPVPHNALRSLCVVTSELPYLYKNGGIGTCNWHLAHLLGQQGWRVHILYCGPNEDPVTFEDTCQKLGRIGCRLTHVGAYEIPPEYSINVGGTTWYLNLSDRIRHVLQEMHRIYHFSLVEFAEYLGLGFRTIQAKRAGLAFDDLTMIVKLHSSSQWLREANQCWMRQVDELLLDHCERYAFENADVQMAPCQYMLDYARSIGWKIQGGAQVVPYVFPETETFGSRVLASPSELVFFGRLETRKGLELFVDAVRQLPNSLKISFVGKETVLSNGQNAGDFIREKLPGLPVSLHTEFDRHQALHYLRSENRLAVIPSLVDNSPNTVIECATHGIPFLASNAGGIPELLPDLELQEGLLFDPNPSALLRRLRQYLELSHSQRQTFADCAYEVMDVPVHNAGVIGNYHALLLEQVLPAMTPAPPVPKVRLAEQEPLVTVAVTYFNLPEYLPETLASLAAQSYDNMEVLVIDDGSTSPIAVRVFEEQRRLYPQFRFISQANGGLSEARNRALSEASGEFFLPVDADNVARPDMVATFVRALRRNPDISALSCYFLAFRRDSDRNAGNFEYFYRPTAGPHVLGCIQNVYGDANSIFRTKDLRAISGYQTDRDSTCEDWEAFVKLINSGYQLDVIPEHLFYYRHRPESLLRTTNQYRNQRRVLRHYFEMDRLPKNERMGLWSVLQGMQSELASLREPKAKLLSVNQLADSGFEVPSLGEGDFAYQYTPLGSPWNFSGTAGVTGNGSAFSSVNPNAPQGNQVAFIQSGGSISQSIDLAAGTYAVSFEAAQRSGSRQQFQVLVDGALVSKITPKRTTYTLYVTAAFTVTSGPHAITFQGLHRDGEDNTAFVDQVLILPNSVRLALGSTHTKASCFRTRNPKSFCWLNVDRLKVTLKKIFRRHRPD